jgi:hypothetical protein
MSPSCARGEHDPLDVSLQGRVEDVEGAFDVHVEAEAGRFRALAGIGHGGQVVDDVVALEAVAEVLADVLLDPGHVLDGGPQVEHGDVVAPVEELLDEMAADEAGAAGDEDFHGRTS